MSIKFLYSKEARDAVDKINDKPISVLNMSGKSIRDIGKEGIQGLYSLTLVKNKVLGPGTRNKEAENELHTMFDNKNGNVTLESVLKIVDRYDVDTTVQWGGKFTSLGRVIFNEVLFAHFGKYEFINENITKKRLGQIMDDFSNKLALGDISVEAFKEMLNKHEQLGFGITDIVSPSISYHMLIEDDPVFKNKLKEVYEKYQYKIEKEHDAVAMDSFKKEMIEFSQEYYKDDPMTDLYESGVGPKWDVDWAMLKIALGGIPDPGTSNVTLVKSNLKDGMQNEDIKAAANLQIAGAFARAQDTALGGYIVTRLNALFQSLRAYKGDCGSKEYLDTIDTRESDLMFRYVLDHGEEVLVTKENIGKYLNKPIKKRSPIFCKGIHGGLCSHCLGEQPFMLTRDDSVNIGLYLPDMGSKILNAYMKATHDMGVKLYKINDLDEFIE